MGQQRLNQAVERFCGVDSDRTVSIEWKPFMIDPGTAPEGERFDDYCLRRWGGSDWTNRLRKEGAKDGAPFENWKWWPNTLKAHQLMLYAQQHHQVDTSVSKAALFHALYEEGENISSTEILIQIARDQLGITVEDNDDQLRTYLTDNQGAVEVMQQINGGRKTYQIRSVPFFVVTGDATNRPYSISGAQDAATLVDIFREVSGEEE